MIKREDTPALLTGLMATFAGLGVARFAFTPLIPELIHQAWFHDSQAVYLGAAALLGYLAGALSGNRISQRMSLRPLMRLCFLGVAMSFVACALPGSFEWFFLWRFIAGACGAILMVVGPSTALTATPESRRTEVGAYVFTGIGLGAALSALVMPMLLQYSLSLTWLTLAGLAALAGLICDKSLARLSRPQGRPSVSATTSTAHVYSRWALVVVLVAYALDAIGYVPHTVFWVDFLDREKALGMQAASTQWVVFGMGAVCGPFIAGALAKRIGWGSGLILAFCAKALAVSLPLLSVDLYSRTLSSFVVGAMVPAIVALTSGRIAELVGPAEHKRYWGTATAVFAVAQAFSGHGLSTLYGVLESYFLLFLIGSVTLAVAALLLALSQTASGQRTSST